MNQSSSSGAAVAPALQTAVETPSTSRSVDQDRAQAADLDLTLTLQLLAERTLFVTGASNVSIWLDEKGKWVPSAQTPPVADPALLSDELTRESLQSHSILCFHDAEKDPRISRLLCEEMGVKSLMLVPLLNDDAALGAVELRSDRFRAFEERDTAAMEHLADLMIVAIENAAAAKRTFKDVILPAAEEPKVEPPKIQEPKKEIAAPPAQSSETKGNPPETKSGETRSQQESVRTCGSCGFPISEGRTICLDCEEAGQSPESALPILSSGSNETWLQANFYTIGIVFMMLATAVLLALRFR